VHDAIVDDILDDLLKREWEKQQRVKSTSDKSSDHNHFQATSDESSDHNLFQVSSDDTLKSSPKDTFSSDSTLEQKKASKGKPGSRSTQAEKKSFDGKQGSSSAKAKKATIPLEIVQWSKHLAPTTPRTGSTCITLVVPTKRQPPVTNCVLGLAAVTTWQQILNKEFRIKKAKENVGGSSDVRRKGKRKMLQEL
ncbi:hypothetical protein Tco_0814853, partial [Tanacetum coccineum]